jgi:hypothetical protein
LLMVISTSRSFLFFKEPDISSWSQKNRLPDLILSDFIFITYFSDTHVLRSFLQRHLCPSSGLLPRDFSMNFWYPTYMLLVLPISTSYTILSERNTRRSWKN